ncbi:unnamed protein product [Bursaphelenchus okinawaensis]|uniref:G_PROTEIN_RECEP_F1_2 domain-containing protein n=1 Tax=Bursaphelenchus okinawaensis TaxID=465554 RepID=A0A811KM58_9BILA|nr:unnamed protein product [Bursaphelenchus okinawaensis]CAG9106442.1 unnamed protein product [Bursaphelenchus okinawaensis]
MLTSDFDNEYAFYLEILVFVLSSLGSAFFMYMIMKKTEQLMEVYKTILMYSSIYDWVVTFTSFFTRPIFFIDQGNCYLISNYFMQMLSDQMQFFFFFTYIFAFHSLPAVVALSYYYRYLVVCKEKIMTTFQFCIFAIFANLGAVLMIVLNSNWFLPRYGAFNQEFTSRLSTIQNSFLLDNKDKIFGIGDSGDPAGLHYYGIGLVVTITAYILIVIYIRKVVNTFRIRDHKTRWHSVNKQIAKSLIVQAITPSVTMVPMFVLMAACVMLQPSEAFVTTCNYIMNITLTIMPVINPFASAAFIDAYRKAALRVCLSCLEMVFKYYNFGSILAWYSYTYYGNVAS